MPEFDLIRLIARRAGAPRADAPLGIGDDAAVLALGARERLVSCVDTLVAGVHFPADTGPADLGWKALAVNLSDLAAMGAEPRFALLALTMPGDDADFVRHFASGFHALARRHGVALVGGDTTRGPLSVTVTALGAVPDGAAIRRDGARVGDVVYASGTLGDAAAGLAVAEGRLADVPVATARALRRRLDRPEPRVALGLALRGLATAMIDVSDGLLADLSHVLAASRVGARIVRDRVPVSAALRRAVPEAEARARFACAGGDDYELVFTAPRASAAQVFAAAERAGVPVTPIGLIERGRALVVVDGDGRPWDPGRRGYVHFDAASATPRAVRRPRRAAPRKTR
jgi:thiamine-monophosphate kinase